MVDDGHLDGEYTGGRRSTPRSRVSSTSYLHNFFVDELYELTSWQSRFALHVRYLIMTPLFTLTWLVPVFMGAFKAAPEDLTAQHGQQRSGYW